MFYEKPKNLDFTSGAIDSAPATWGEIYDDSYRATKLSYEMLSQQNAIEEAYDRRLKSIFDATGQRRENPMRTFVQHDEQPLGVEASPARDPKAQIDFQLWLDDLATQHPDKLDAIRPDLSPYEEAKRLAREAEAKETETFDRTPGLGKYVPYVGAQLSAAATDQTNVLALAFGPFGEVGAGARAVLWNGVKAGAANAATEAVAQPFVQGWRQSAGLDYGVSQAALQVTFAGMFGFAADAGIRGGYRGAKLGTRSAGRFFGSETPPPAPFGAPRDRPLDALEAAARAAPEGSTLRRASEGDEKAIRDVAELTGAIDDPAVRGALQELERAKLFGPPPEMDRGEHFSRLASAIQRSLDPESIPPGDAVQGPAPARAWPQLAEDAAAGSTETVDGKPVQYRTIDPKKTANDTEILATMRQGDGAAIAFETNDGRFILQRQAARRNETEGGAPAAHVFKEADGWTLDEARVFAARKSLEEMSGSPVDMAILLRRRPDLADRTLPITQYKFKQAIGLARLSDDAFDRVAGGEIPANFAAVLGNHVNDQARHAGLVQQMAAANIKSEKAARIFIGQALAEPVTAEDHGIRFGQGSHIRGLIGERVQVLDQALALLSKDKRVFAVLEKEAPRIKRVGNVLDDAANVERQDLAKRLTGLIAKLSETPSRVSDLLETAALEVASGVKPRVAAQNLVRQVADILEADGIRGLTQQVAPPRADAFLNPQPMKDPFGPEAQAQTERLKQRAKQREALEKGDDEDDVGLASIGGNKDRLKAYEFALKIGRAVVLPERLKQEVHAELADFAHLVPEGTNVGVLAKLQPTGQGKVRATFETADGSTFVVDARLDDLVGAGGLYLPSLKALAFLSFLDVSPSDLTGRLDLRAVVHHELVHAIRAENGVPEILWRRLVAHADDLAVLELTFVVDGKRTTIGDHYRQRYAGQENLQELLDQEAVAFMVEMHQRGAFDAEDLAPVIDDLAELFSGGKAIEAATAASTEPLFAIAGIKAKNADLRKLERAQQLEAQGENYFRILQQTGWERGADGQWKFELSDRDARMIGDARDVLGGRRDKYRGGDRVISRAVWTKVGDAIDNPLVFEAYPELKDWSIRVQRTRVAGASSKGSVDFAAKHIDIVAKSPARAVEKIVHELQHVIQRKEGFAEGGSPMLMGAFSKRAIEDLDAQAASVMERLSAVGDGDPELLDQLARLRSDREDLEKQGMVSLYLSLAGETEARNVERRLTFRRGERLGTSMQRTEDVPRDIQILRRDPAVTRMLGEDDWQDEWFAQLGRRDAQTQQTEWQKSAKAIPPDKRGMAAIEWAANDLREKVATFERALWEAGETAEEIALKISNKFGFPVEPEQVATRQVWWKIDEMTKAEQSRINGRKNVGGARVWTDDVVSRLRDLEGRGMAPNEIAEAMSEEFGRSFSVKDVKNAIVGKLGGRKAPVRSTKDWTPEETAALKAKDVEGMSSTETAEFLSKTFRRPFTGDMVRSRKGVLRRAEQREAERPKELGDMAKVCKR